MGNNSVFTYVKQSRSCNPYWLELNAIQITHQCKTDADEHEEAGDEVNNEHEGDEEDGDARHHEVPDDLSVHVLQKVIVN